MIYVHGYYGYKNCGDEAFKCVFNKYLKDLNFIYTSPNNPPPENPNTDDLIILGGGNVIDGYFLNHLKNWKRRVYAVGIGLSTAEGLDTLAQLEPLCCYVRNKSELESVRAKIPCAEYIPDIVFSLTSNDIVESPVGLNLPQIEQTHSKRNELEKTAVIILSNRILSYLYVEESFNSGVQSLNGMLKLIDFLKFVGLYYNLHFLSFSNDFYHPDDSLHSLIASTLVGKRDRISFSSFGAQPSKAFEVIQGANIVFSMKFHSLVFSIIARKPIINLSDAPKCLSLIDELGLSDCSCPLSLGISMDALKHSLKIAEGNLLSVNVESLQDTAHKEMLKFSQIIKSKV